MSESRVQSFNIPQANGTVDVANIMDMVAQWLNCWTIPRSPMNLNPSTALGEQTQIIEQIWKEKLLSENVIMKRLNWHAKPIKFTNAISRRKSKSLA